MDPWPCSVGRGSVVAVRCSVGCRRGSDPALLWLWRRPVAMALIGPLAWESPYAARAALEKAKKKTNEQTKKSLKFRKENSVKSMHKQYEKFSN